MQATAIILFPLTNAVFEDKLLISMISSALGKTAPLMYKHAFWL
jgi:hypothetical protein